MNFTSTLARVIAVFQLLIIHIDIGWGDYYILSLNKQQQKTELLSTKLRIIIISHRKNGSVTRADMAYTDFLNRKLPNRHWSPVKVEE